MKKIIFIITTLLLTTVGITSCMNENNGNTAAVNYVGLVDSIGYSVPGDSVWEKNIIEALAKMEISGYVFEAKDTASTGLPGYVIQLCDFKAAKMYDDMLKKANLADLKKTIYKEHADSLNKLGYVGSDAIPLQKFVFKSTLYSFYSGNPLFYYYKNVE